MRLVAEIVRDEPATALAVARVALNVGLHLGVNARIHTINSELSEAHTLGAYLDDADAEALSAPITLPVWGELYTLSKCS